MESIYDRKNPNKRNFRKKDSEYIYRYMFNVFNSLKKHIPKIIMHDYYIPQNIADSYSLTFIFASEFLSKKIKSLDPIYQKGVLNYFSRVDIAINQAYMPLVHTVSDAYEVEIVPKNMYFINHEFHIGNYEREECTETLDGFVKLFNSGCDGQIGFGGVLINKKKEVLSVEELGKVSRFTILSLTPKFINSKFVSAKYETTDLEQSTIIKDFLWFYHLVDYQYDNE